MGKRKGDALRTARVGVMFSDGERDQLKEIAKSKGKTLATEVYDRVRYSLRLPDDFDFSAARDKHSIIVILRQHLIENNVIPHESSTTTFLARGAKFNRSLRAVNPPGLSGFGIGSAYNLPIVYYDLVTLYEERKLLAQKVVRDSNVPISEELMTAMFRDIQNSGVKELTKKVTTSVISNTAFQKLSSAEALRAIQFGWQSLHSIGDFWECDNALKFVLDVSMVIEKQAENLCYISDPSQYQSAYKEAIETLSNACGRYTKTLNAQHEGLTRWSSLVRHKLSEMQGIEPPSDMESAIAKYLAEL